MLFLGTDNFIYITWDDGGHWTLLRNNMPPAPIYWLTIQKRYNDLVVATYGRGFWILDDITALRDWDKAQQADVYFFQPRAAFRYRHFGSTHAIDTYNKIVGQNPPPGADLNYFLKAPAKKVEITVMGANGEAIRTLAGPTQPGINRIWWDLRYAGPEVVKLRNSPPGEPWVKTGPEGWRPLVHWRNYNQGPQVTPGKYTIKLNVDGKESTQTLEVVRDPNDLAKEPEIKANVDFQLRVRNEMTEAGRMINRIEWTRKQLGDLEDHARRGSNECGARSGGEGSRKEDLRRGRQVLPAEPHRANRRCVPGAFRALRESGESRIRRRERRGPAADGPGGRAEQGTGAATRGRRVRLSASSTNRQLRNSTAWPGSKAFRCRSSDSRRESVWVGLRLSKGLRRAEHTIDAVLLREHDGGLEAFEMS